MTSKGLLLQFLPPFNIIGRFFLTASLFGLIGSLLALYMSISKAFNLPPLVHSFTLGFLATAMVGALFQMLPVVAGAVIKRAVLKATAIHVLLLIGIPIFLIGLLSGRAKFTLTGAILVAIGLMGASVLFLIDLLRVKSHVPTSRGMKFSILNFAVGILLAILLALDRSGFHFTDYGRVLNLHLSFVLIGWIFLLIASVSFQVVEMFFVTPPYPKRFAWLLPPLITLLLLLKIILGDLFIIDIFLSALMILQALLTLDRFRKRRRKIPDPLINFWQVGMVALIASSLLYPFLQRFFLLFLFLFGTFAQSVVFAMMYRIVPFLVWLHISNKGVPNPPTMHEVISRKRIYVSLYVHLFSVLSLFVAYLIGFGWLYVIASAAYTLSFLILFLNLSSAILLYIRRVYGQGASLPLRQDRR